MSTTAMQDVLVRIATDAEFLREIQADPGLLTSRFGLSAEEVAVVAAARLDARSAGPQRLEERLSRTVGPVGSAVIAVAEAAEQPEPEAAEPDGPGADAEPAPILQTVAPDPAPAEQIAAEPVAAEPAAEEIAEPAPDEMAEPATEDPADPAPEEMAEPATEEMAEPATEGLAEPSIYKMEPAVDPVAPDDVGVVEARVHQALTEALAERDLELPPEVQANLSRAIADVLTVVQGADAQEPDAVEPAFGAELMPAGPELTGAEPGAAAEPPIETTTADAEGNQIRVSTTVHPEGGYTQVHHNVDGSTDTYAVSDTGLITHSHQPATHAPGSVEPPGHVPGTPLPGTADAPATPSGPEPEPAEFIRVEWGGPVAPDVAAALGSPEPAGTFLSQIPLDQPASVVTGLEPVHTLDLTPEPQGPNALAALRDAGVDIAAVQELGAEPEPVPAEGPNALAALKAAGVDIGAVHEIAAEPDAPEPQPSPADTEIDRTQVSIKGGYHENRVYGDGHVEVTRVADGQVKEWQFGTMNEWRSTVVDTHLRHDFDEGTLAGPDVYRVKIFGDGRVEEVKIVDQKYIWE